MPYLANTGKAALDPKIKALHDYMFGSDATPGIITKRNANFFFSFVLTVLYEKCVGSGKERRYRDWNALQGAFECALKELFFRWKEAGILFPSPHADPPGSQLCERGLLEDHSYDMQVKIEILVGDLASVYSDNLLEVAVGEINYSISEIANKFGNTGLLDHKVMLNTFAWVNEERYRHHVFAYEKLAIQKNGDTAGFIEFVQKASINP